MEKQDKSPMKFLGGGLAAIATKGSGNALDMVRAQAQNNNMAPAALQNPTPGSMISNGIQAAQAQAPTPAPATTGLVDSTNPFGGRTFTISPAQMKNVENVFGDINERQASVGQNIEQSDENYDAYGEESPLMKKSCGSYKK